MKRNTYVSAAAAVVLAVGGPLAAAATASADTAKALPAAVSARADVSAEAAVAAALKAYPGVVESLDRDGAVWHVDVVSKDGTHAELEVDAASGGVTKERQDDEPRPDDYAGLLAAKVTADQAIKTALAAHPGLVWEVDWEGSEDGRAAYWDVEVKKTDGRTQNVHVDTATAKVVPSNGDDGGDGGTDGDGNN